MAKILLGCIVLSVDQVQQAAALEMHFLQPEAQMLDSLSHSVSNQCGALFYHVNGPE